MPPSFLVDGGKVGALLRAYNWSKSPLGQPDTWSYTLRPIIGLILQSRFPMFVAWGPDLGFLYNDAYAEILGTKHLSALGSRFKDVWPEIWDEISPLVNEALSGKAVYVENLPLTVQRRGGDEQTWFTFSYSPIRDESGTVAGMYCAVTETTRQVIAEQSRIAENERLRRLFEQAPGLMVVLREPGHIFELANAAYFELVGQRELIGRPVEDALPELNGQGFYELLDGVYSSGEPHIGRGNAIKLQRRHGSELEERYIDFIYQPIKNSANEVTGIFIEGSDVTEAVLANRALLDNEKQMRQLANTIPQLAWMTDSEGAVYWYNNRWYEYTGTTFEQVKGWGWQSLTDSEILPAILETWRNALTSGSEAQMTFPLRGADGHSRQFFTLVAPLRDADGRIVQWFGTNTDVTDLENARNEQRKANQLKDEFLAMLAHELRNPLAPIRTAAHVLQTGNLDEPTIRRTSSVIARQVNHMTKLVDDLLDVSRVTRGLIVLNREVLNLNNVVAEALEQVHWLIDLKHLHLQVHFPTEMIVLEGDKTRLTQIFANILNNAAKYTPSGEDITLRLALLEDEVEFSVRDTGIGIAPELLPGVFNLFTQAERSADRSQGGLGIGLALVKSLVELHGGKVLARSDGMGKGSEFIVRLSHSMRLKQSKEHKEDAAYMQDGIENVLNLMVVDDNVDAAVVMSMFLETLGHTVATEHSGQGALVRARNQRPHIIFMDIGLPDIDGYQLAQRLRAMPETAQSVLVAVTGYAQPQDKARALEAGFDFHLVKPVPLELLRDLVGSYTNRNSGDCTL